MPKLKWIQLQRLDWKLLLLCLGLSLVIYAPSLRGPYILDDSHTIQTNDAIKNPSNFFNIWSSGRFSSSSPDNWGYRPLTTSYMWLSWWIGHGDTLPFHLLKVTFFSFTVLFFILFWRSLMPGLSDLTVFIGGLFFLVNPVHTQVVSYISATSTLLSGMLAALCLWQFVVFRKTGSLLTLNISLVAAFFSLFAKEEGVVILGLIPLIEVHLRLLQAREEICHEKGATVRVHLWQALARKSVWQFRWQQVATYVLYLLVIGTAVAVLISKFEPTSDLARGTMDRWTYFATQFRAYLRYMAMYFVPYDLNADNLQFGFATGWGDPLVWVTVLINIALLLLGLFLWAWSPTILFLLLWFYCAVSPASSVVVLAEPVNDHRAFLPYLGWGGLIMVSLEAILRWIASRPVLFGGLTQRTLMRVLTGAVALVLVGYGGWTFARNITWSSNVNLWEDTLAKNPGSVRAHNNAALNYMHRMEWKRAAEILDHCLVIEPGYAYCLINRAIVGNARGEEVLTEQLFQRAVIADFAGVNARRYYGEFLFARGRLSAALPLAQAADQAAQGKNLFVRLLMIKLHMNMGETEKAREIWQESVETFGEEPGLMSLKESL